jgi:hypothetical protein
MVAGWLGRAGLALAWTIAARRQRRGRRIGLLGRALMADEPVGVSPEELEARARPTAGRGRGGVEDRGREGWGQPEGNPEVKDRRLEVAGRKGLPAGRQLPFAGRRLRTRGALDIGRVPESRVVGS